MYACGLFWLVCRLVFERKSRCNPLYSPYPFPFCHPFLKNFFFILDFFLFCCLSTPVPSFILCELVSLSLDISRYFGTEEKKHLRAKEREREDPLLLSSPPCYPSFCTLLLLLSTFLPSCCNFLIASVSPSPLLASP